MKRACIGDDKPHPASKAKTLQVGPITVEVARAVAADNAMAYEERVELATRSETENPLQFGAGQTLEPKLVDRERLEGASLNLVRRSETRCEFVRDAEGYVHGLFLEWNGRPAQDKTRTAMLNVFRMEDDQTGRLGCLLHRGEPPNP
jgi:hypothetical protein